MTVRPILSIGNPLLRVRSEKVDPEDIKGRKWQRIIKDMIDTMRDAEGAGLAANQIGVTRRIVVVEVKKNRRYPYKPPIPLTVMINPRFEPIYQDTVMINEGCLSVPLRGEVERFVNIRMRYFDEDGNKHREVVRGLKAATFQHECDHLDGVLITDRAKASTLTTWDEFAAHGRKEFIERITAFVDEIGS